jgi:hypothetical protein
MNPSKIVQELALSRLDSKEEGYVRYSAESLRGENDLVIAEVGVEAGFNAIRLLRNLDIKKMYLIDWYKPNKYYDKKTVSKQKYTAYKLLEPYKDKIVWLKGDSVEMADKIEEPLDYVYIDGDHSFKGVYRDIVAWWPKVKMGGTIGGHDFTCFSACRNGVMKYALENDLIISFKFQDWKTIK